MCRSWRTYTDEELAAGLTSDAGISDEHGVDGDAREDPREPTVVLDLEVSST